MSKALFGLGALGLGLYLLTRKSTPVSAGATLPGQNGWKAMQTPVPLPYEVLDRAAQAILGKNELLQAEWGITRPTSTGAPEAAMASGSVKSVDMVDGHRVWRVEFQNILMPPNVANPPAPGASFTLDDRAIAVFHFPLR